MKIFIKVKYLVKRYFIIGATLIALSCGEDSITYNQGNGVELVVVDPYVRVTTPVIGFQAGKPEYEFSFDVVNGVKELTEVNVYSTFTDAETGLTSNEVLLGSFPIEDPVVSVQSQIVTYNDLKTGLTVDGNPLPASDLDVKVGSGWVLRFEGILTSGAKLQLRGTVNIAVLSRFAGIYKVVDSDYYRIGVAQANWNDQTRFIGSVNETTFSYNDFWGGFTWSGNQFNFSVDFSTNKITVPITVDGIYSGTRPINCTDDASLFTNVPCDGSNVLIPDDATGKHRIIITYGYFSDGAGPSDVNRGAREFSEILEKVVD